MELPGLQPQPEPEPQVSPELARNTPAERVWAAKKTILQSQGLVLVVSMLLCALLIVLPCYVLGEIVGPLSSEGGVRWVAFCESKTCLNIFMLCPFCLIVVRQTICTLDLRPLSLSAVGSKSQRSREYTTSPPQFCCHSFLTYPVRWFLQ